MSGKGKSKKNNNTRRNKTSNTQDTSSPRVKKARKTNVATNQTVKESSTASSSSQVETAGTSSVPEVSEQTPIPVVTRDKSENMKKTLGSLLHSPIFTGSDLAEAPLVPAENYNFDEEQKTFLMEVLMLAKNHKIIAEAGIGDEVYKLGAAYFNVSYKSTIVSPGAISTMISNLNKRPIRDEEGNLVPNVSNIERLAEKFFHEMGDTQ